MLKVGFIGAGTVGTAMAVRLQQRGYPVVAAASRTFASAQKLAAVTPGCVAYSELQEVADRADLVFITTPDGAISQVARRLVWHSGQFVLHCSGADSLEPLQPALEFGASIGGFHPLQTFASAAVAIDNLPGSTFALEADEPLVPVLKKIAGDLQGNWVVLKAGEKVLYHAAAVMASNYFVTLVKLAADLWQDFGATPEEAVKALMPLLKGTLNNISNVGLPNCLTGPIARGDLGTIQKHLAAMEKTSPELLSAYREMGTHTIPIALAKGKVTPETAALMQQLLNVKQEVRQ